AHRPALAYGERRAAGISLSARGDAGVPLPLPLAGELRGLLGQPLRPTPRDVGLLPAAAPRPPRDHQRRQALLPGLTVDFEYAPEQQAFREEFRAWLGKNLPPDLCLDDPADDRVASDRETFE